MGTTNSRSKNAWILLGLFTLTVSLALVWPDHVEGHPATIGFHEVKISSVLSGDRTAIASSFRDGYLTITTPYTVYLPIITQAPLPEPLNTLLVLINTERQKHGLPPLRINSVLMQVAQAHSQNMAERGFFDHVDPATGLGPCERISGAGYAFRTCAENIAAGYRTAEAVFQAWMSSSGHRANLLSPDFTEIGLGYAEGGFYRYYWTVNLACPQEIR